MHPDSSGDVLRHGSGNPCSSARSHARDWMGMGLRRRQDDRRRALACLLRMVAFCFCGHAKMARGDTCGTCFEYTGGGVAFLNYMPKVANMPAAISFNIRSTTFLIEKGSKVELSLPGFSLCADACTSISTRSILFEHALRIAASGIWDEVNKKLSFDVPDQVNVNVTIAGKVPLSAGLRLPRTGLKVDQNSLLYGQSAVFQSPAVGSFVPDVAERNTKSTRVSYEPTTSSGATRPIVDVVITFLHRMMIWHGENVTLTLPYFIGASFELSDVVEPASIRNGAGKFLCSWNNNTFKLALQFQKGYSAYMEPGFLENLRVKGNLRVASYGMAQNDHGLTIESDANDGPVSPVPVVSSPYVKAVITWSSLRFCEGQCIHNGFEWMCNTRRARPAERTEITLLFILDIDMQPGETMVIRLPGFGGPSRHRFSVARQPLCQLDVHPPLKMATVALEHHPYGCVSNEACRGLNYTGSAIFGLASWSSEAQELTLTARQVAAKGKEHVAVVPIDVGISVPSSGVRANTSDVMLESDCAAGPIPRAPWLQTLAVGALQDMSLTFSPPVAGSPTRLHFSFTFMMNLELDDVIELTLQDFNDEEVDEEVGAISVLSSPATFSGNALWMKTSKTFKFICKQKTLAGTKVQVTIESSNGLKLPFEGVVPDSGKHRFALIAQHGWISDSNIRNIQRVPAILDKTELRYSEALGFDFSEVEFEFTARHRLAEGYAIEICLSGFLGTESAGSAGDKVTSKISENDGVTFQEYAKVRSYSWKPGADSKLEIVLDAAVDVNQTVIFVFKKTVGVSLPAFGIAANSTRLTVSVNRAIGQPMMLPIPIQASPSIDAILRNASLSFGAVRAGAATDLNVQFFPDFANGFAKGDNITVRLPGFKYTSKSPSLSDAILSNEHIQEATWMNNGVIFVVKKPFSSLTMNVNLKKEAGIILPDAGVRYATQDLIIEGNVASKGMFTAILQVQAVGAFKGSPTLTFGGSNPAVGTLPVPGVVSSIDMSFTPLMDLYPGDTVTLTCQGFFGTSNDRVIVSSSPSTAVRWATWDTLSISGVGLLIFKIASALPIPAGSLIKVGLPTGIARIPVQGLTTCSNSSNTSCPISISVSAQKGDIAVDPRSWVTEYEPIGNLDYIFLRCIPPSPGIMVGIELILISSWNLASGDKVTASLDRFSIEKTPSNEYQVNGVAKTNVNGMSAFDDANIIMSGSTLKIILTAKRSVPGLTKQIIQIPASAGIITPKRGFPTEDNTILQVSVSSKEGDVSGLPVSNLQRVGAVVDAVFALDPPSAGYVSEISIVFTPTMSVLKGEYFNFYLPAFSGPVSRVTSVVSKTRNATGWFPSPYITQIQWNLESESFNATVAKRIPANTRLMLIVGRDSLIAIPGKGVVDQSRSMFISAHAINGMIYRQPIRTETIIQPFLTTRNLEVVPKRAGSPAKLIISLQSRVKLNPDTTILLTLKDFTGGDDCWNALPGSPLHGLRCLTQDRAETCGNVIRGPCSTDVRRYCLPLPPGIIAFRVKTLGGCRFEPKVYLGPHSQVGFSKNPGSCTCLAGAKYDRMYTSAVRYWNTTGNLQLLPHMYGSSCWPWDIATKSGIAVDCPQFHNGQAGPHCCSSFCFVEEKCASAVPWHGYSGSEQESLDKAYISYDTCNDDAGTVKTCPYKFPIEGKLGIADASWTLIDSNLILTLKSPIVAFTPITVHVPVEQKITLPELGLSPTLSEVKIDALDVRSKNRMIPIRLNLKDSIGAFFNATLDFQEYTAGAPVPMTVGFTPQMHIEPGESVTVILHGFELDTSSKFVTKSNTLNPPTYQFQISSQPNNFQLVTWNEQETKLEILASQRVDRGTPFEVYLPRVLRLPHMGLTPESSLFIISNAAEAQVTEALPYRLKSARLLGAVWNTAVTFDPPVFDQPVNVTFEFRNAMELATGDMVSLRMPDFSGPLTTDTSSDSWNVQPSASEPKETMYMLWKNNGKIAPEITIGFMENIRLPRNTTFRITIPASCAFVDTLLRCKKVPGISRPSPKLSGYDPAKLSVSVKARTGRVDNVPVRISSFLSPSPAFKALQGTWKGVSQTATGFLKTSNVSHIMSCLSTGFRCPSQGAYECKTIQTNTELLVNAEARQARIITTAGSLDANTMGAYRGGDFEILDFSSNGLLLKNVTASEHLIDEVVNGEKTKVDGITFCSYTRAVYRVELDGSYDIAMELYTEYLYRSLSGASGAYSVIQKPEESSPVSYNLRLRLNVTANKYYHSFGLEMGTPSFFKNFEDALSKSWKVDNSHIVWSKSTDGRYQDVSICHKKTRCDLEIIVYAQTDNQKLHPKLWARQVFEAIKYGDTVEKLRKNNLLIFLTILEPLYISPDTSVITSCPSIPVGRTGQPYGGWPKIWPPQSPVKGENVGKDPFGFASKDTATCHRRRGANDGDQIFYNDSFTIKFGVISLLTRVSTEAVISNFDSNGDGKYTGTITTAKASNAIRTHLSSWMQVCIWCLCGYGLALESVVF